VVGEYYNPTALSEPFMCTSTPCGLAGLSSIRPRRELANAKSPSCSENKPRTLALAGSLTSRQPILDRSRPDRWCRAPGRVQALLGHALGLCACRAVACRPLGPDRACVALSLVLGTSLNEAPEQVVALRDCASQVPRKPGHVVTSTSLSPWRLGRLGRLGPDAGSARARKPG
jgi:hypothetical protein